MLNFNYADRMARNEEKRSTVMRFLADEVYSDSPTIGLIAGINYRQGVHRLLVSLEKDGFVRRAEAPTMRGRGGAILWGITPHGRAMTSEADPLGPVFDATRVSWTAVPHALDLQKARYNAEKGGWTDWERFREKREKGDAYPDAVGMRQDGVRFAIEVERNIKRKDRYQVTFLRHLEAIRDGKWAGVYYLAPDDRTAKGLERVLTSLETLVGGKAFTDAEKKRFRVLPISEFPPQLKG